MDYKKIVSSAYSWMSVEKAKMFLIFFWISLPFIIILPAAFEKNLIYNEVTKPIALCLYDILYLTLILGIIVLIQYCLKSKKEKVASVSLSKLAGFVKLVFAEAFYVLFWNLNKKIRVSQILILISSALFFILASVFPNPIWDIALFISVSVYALVALYNFGRVFFSSTIYCNEDYSIKEAIMRSWSLTHGKMARSFSPILWVVVLVFLLFTFVTLALGSFAAIFLKLFLIEPLAISIGFRVASAFALAPCIVAYHYAITSVYVQLKQEQSSSTSIKRILAHRVLHKKTASVKRKTAKRK